MLEPRFTATVTRSLSMPMRAAKEKRSPTFLDRNPTPALSKLRTLSPTSTRMHQQQRLRHQVQEAEDEIVKVGDRFGGRNDFGNLRRRRCSIGGGGDSSLFFVHAPLAVSCFVSAPKPKRLGLRFVSLPTNLS
ncbi:hypothetical protein GYH30_033263 [Glycine max]|nr:hypothetical protein GYH30_033263 [Glycine max]